MGPVFYIWYCPWCLLFCRVFLLHGFLYITLFILCQHGSTNPQKWHEFVSFILQQLITLPQLVKLSVTMFNVHKYLLFIFCTIKLCLAELRISDLKSCKEEKHKSNICLTGKNGCLKPFPVTVDSNLMLRNLIEIDENKNSISAQFTFICQWTFINEKVGNQKN